MSIKSIQQLVIGISILILLTLLTIASFYQHWSMTLLLGYFFISSLLTEIELRKHRKLMREFDKRISNSFQRR